MKLGLIARTWKYLLAVSLGAFAVAAVPVGIANDQRAGAAPQVDHDGALAQVNNAILFCPANGYYSFDFNDCTRHCPVACVVCFGSCGVE